MHFFLSGTGFVTSSAVAYAALDEQPMCATVTASMDPKNNPMIWKIQIYLHDPPDDTIHLIGSHTGSADPLFLSQSQV